MLYFLAQEANFEKLSAEILALYQRIKFAIVGFLNLTRLPLNWFHGNCISLSSRVSRPSKVVKTSIGKYCFVGPFSCLKNAEIGAYCSIAPSVNIGGMEHPYRYASTSTRIFPPNLLVEKRTWIGEDVWIGAGAIVRQGVKIGRGAVIGAGSIVMHDVPPYAIAFGSPAVIKKQRFSPDLVTRLSQSNYWRYPPSKAKKIIADLIASGAQFPAP